MEGENRVPCFRDVCSVGCDSMHPPGFHFTQGLWSLGKSHNFLVPQLPEMEEIVVCVHARMHACVLACALLCNACVNAQVYAYILYKEYMYIYTH